MSALLGTRVTISSGIVAASVRSPFTTLHLPKKPIIGGDVAARNNRSSVDGRHDLEHCRWIPPSVQWRSNVSVQAAHLSFLCSVFVAVYLAFAVPRKAQKLLGQVPNINATIMLCSWCFKVYRICRFASFRNTPALLSNIHCSLNYTQDIHRPEGLKTTWFRVDTNWKVNWGRFPFLVRGW